MPRVIEGSETVFSIVIFPLSFLFPSMDNFQLDMLIKPGLFMALFDYFGCNWCMFIE